ncbi:MAG: hypothetical protein F4Y02_13330 [Chloroflexi bacterium]|nr:hypothetical protein [Chloroflexota bacterium]
MRHPPDFRGPQLPGADLTELVSRAERELVIAAPFIKAPVLASLLEHAGAVPVTCITRWRPEEVAAGVSDLEVSDVLAGRAGSRLLLWPLLHAKYFRADARCLIGSANVTGRALGWSAPPNIELLIDAPATHPRLAAFEQRARAEARPATQEVRTLIGEAAAEIRRERLWPVPPSEPRADEPPEDDDRHRAPLSGHRLWLPSLRQPANLHTAYSGGLDQLTVVAREAALRDLAVLDPAAGLPAAAFSAVIAAALLQMPMIARIDEFTAESQRFGAVRDLIAAETGLPSREAGEAWQTTMRWLLHFIPNRYRRTVPSYSEVFVRVTPYPADETPPAS